MQGQIFFTRMGSGRPGSLAPSCSCAVPALTLCQVDELTGKHSIYLTRNGRISMAGVNTRNVERLARALHMVTTQ